jgi:hypothetical protein
MNETGEEELAKSVSNVIVQVEVEENMDIMFCLTDLNGFCLNSGNFEITIEANKIQTASVGFSVENRGNVDAEVAFGILMPDGTTGSEVYFDENIKEWRVAISPSETELYSIGLDAGDSMDWGAIAVIAREVLPGNYNPGPLGFCEYESLTNRDCDKYVNEDGSYSFTLKLMLVTETTNSGTYAFETLEQVTITVIVEGDLPENNSGKTEDDSLLPGPSFISIVTMLAIIVYRRKR